MSKVLLAALIIVGMPLSLCAQEVSLSLDEAVALALRDNRQVLLAAEDIKKAQAHMQESESGFFPSLSFKGTWADYRGLYAKDMWQAGTQFTAQQPLFKGGRTVNSIAQSRFGVQAAQAGLEKASLDTVAYVKKAFYTLLLAQEYAALNKAITDNTKAHLESAQARYENGQVSGTELLRIKESLAGIEEVYEASLSQKESSAGLLRNMLYLKDDITVTPKGVLGCQPQDVAYDEGFLKAMRTRPEIRQLEAQEKIAQKSVEIVKADARPTINASWDYYSRSHTAGVLNATGKGWNDYTTIGFNFSWPIFDGWQTKHRVEQAIIDLKQAQLGRQQLSKDIALEVKNAYLSLKDALASLKRAQSAQLVYDNTLKTAQERQAKGMASSLEADDAALAKKIADFNYTQATYEYMIAKISFERATGGL